MRRLRERLALRIAPWLYVDRREEREEAFRDLAEIAYLSRDAVWTSPRVLVQSALREAARKRKPNPDYDPRADHPERFMRDGVWQVDV